MRSDPLHNAHPPISSSSSSQPPTIPSEPPAMSGAPMPPTKSWSTVSPARTEAPHLLLSYCGGTWNGLQSHLDYIQGMGFDAVWISPISVGIEGMTGDGMDYTGYWVNDLTKLNSNFGTKEDLLAFSQELHRQHKISKTGRGEWEGCI